MKPRSAMPQPERRDRSRLAQLAHAAAMLRGSLVLMRHTCGKPSCRCARGHKHESWYVGFSAQGRKRMVYVPRAWLPKVQQWVADYHQAHACLKRLADRQLQRLQSREHNP